MPNQENQLLDLSDWFDDEVKKSEKKLAKKSEKKKKSGDFKPDENRFQDENSQLSALKRNHLDKEEQKQHKIKETLTPSEKFLEKQTKQAIELFKNNNKRLKFHKERIEILTEQFKQYNKIGNKEAANACEEELNRLKKEYTITITAFEQTSKEDYEKFNEKINITDIKKSIKETEEALEQAKLESNSSEILRLKNKLNEENLKLEESENHNMWLVQKEEVKLKIKEINETIRTSNFTSISRIMTDIKKGLEILNKIELLEDKDASQNIDEIEDLEDQLNDIETNQDILEDIEYEIEEDENGASESVYLMKLSEITKLPIQERIVKLVELIHSIIPDKLKSTYTVDKIQTLIVANNQKTIKQIINKFKNEKEIEKFRERKEELENELNSLNNKLKKNSNIVDFIFDYLNYDETDDEEKAVSRNILIQYSILWSKKIINKVISQFNLIQDKELISDLMSEAATVISVYSDKWFKNRAEGKIREWFNFIAVPIKQSLVKFIIEWRSHGTISGTAARQIDYELKKRINDIKTSLGKDNLSEESENILTEYATKLVEQEGLSDMFKNIDNASTFEARVGGGSGDEDKIDFGSYMSKDELDPYQRGEIQIAHNELIKNMGKLLSLLEPDKKTKKKTQIFTADEILLIKLELGLIYNKKTNKNYTQKECAFIITQFCLNNNLPIGGNKDISKTERNIGKPRNEWTISPSGYNTRKINIFGNLQLVQAAKKRWEMYEKGLLKTKPTEKSRILIRGKLFEILDRPENQELKDTFKDLCEFLRDSSCIREISAEALENNELIDTIDTERTVNLNYNKDDVFVNNKIDVDLVIGDTEYEDNEISEIWSDMIDFTGLNI